MKTISVMCVVMVACMACDKNTRGDDNTPTPATTQATAPPAQTTQEPEVKPDGKQLSDIPVVRALEHGSLLLEWEDFTVAIDPVTPALEANEGEEPGADLILITHVHGDHLDPEAIKTLRKEGAQVITPEAVAQKAGDALPEPTLMANGQTLKVLDDRLTIEAVPMYNLKRMREDTGKPFHVKGEGNGYVITRGGHRVYISGDTECTPEMKSLRDIDMAFVCMNLPYTMTVEEAAVCIREFKPAALYPYHYRGQDPSKLPGLLEGVPVKVESLEWYPGGQ